MGALTDAIRRLIDSLQISSASPGHINEVLQTDPGIDLDEALEEAQKDNNVKTQKETNDTIKDVKRFKTGNVGEIQRMGTEQFGNIREMAANPFLFVTRKVFGKFAKGAGIVALLALIRVAVTFIVSELLKPGRLLDRRFRLNFEEQLLQFRQRESQQKLKQGFSGIIITTSPYLRGGQGQTTNTLTLVTTGQFPQNIGQRDIILEASGVSPSKNKGASRGSRRYNR